MADLTEVFTVEADTPQAVIDTINGYLQYFRVPPHDKETKHFSCYCGAALSGILSRFHWGMVHGEGYCGGCGRQIRMYHDIKDEQAESMLRFTFPLLYTLSRQGVETRLQQMDNPAALSIREIVEQGFKGFALEEVATDIQEILGR